MTALCGFVALNSPFATQPIGQLAGWFGLVFFPLCGAVAVRQLFRVGAVMAIGPEGLRWRRWSEDTIPWCAFSRAAGIEIQRQRMLTLWFADPEAHRSTTLLGRLAGANKALGAGDLTLTAQGTNRRFEEMAEAVYRYAPQLFKDPA